MAVLKSLRLVSPALFLVHWLMAGAVCVSFVTGLRIATDNQSDSFYSALNAWLPQGDAFVWHLLSAAVLLSAFVGYLFYLYRSGLAMRLVPKSEWLGQLKSNQSVQRWWVFNRMLYWLYFILFGCALSTGLINYLYSIPRLEYIHSVVAWGFLFFLVLHILGHLLQAGLTRLLSIFIPALSPRILGLLFLVLLVSGVSVYQLSRFSFVELDIVSTDVAPTIDGHLNDEVWRSIDGLRIHTSNGANFVNGEATVEVKAAHDGQYVYFSFSWDDPTRSQKHLPLVKTKAGWKVMQTDFLRADEDSYYEDKFALLLAGNDPFAAIASTHLGAQPLPEQPGPFGGRGLHYTTDGAIYDLWHWKSVRTDPHWQADDNFIGPPQLMPDITPRQFSEDRDGNYMRYTAGYKKDPPTTWKGYSMNWEVFKTGITKPRRLPKDIDDLENLGRIDLSPDESDNGQWWMEWNDTKPYMKEHDRLAEGTVLPSVLVKQPLAGDRGHIKAKGRWENGRWYLEMQRLLNTESKYDVAIKDNTFMWVAVFDHTQTRHTRHLVPIRLTVD